MLIAIINRTKKQSNSERLKVRLALLGNVVITPVDLTIIDDIEETEARVGVLQEQYREALSLCNLAVAIMEDNYIGDGTMDEIELCIHLGKPTILARSVDEALVKYCNRFQAKKEV